jgi:predicted nuclease of predicted toxin-antitoxin system
VIRFHLDENVHHGIGDGLRLRGVDVSTSSDADLVSASDERQLEFAIREGRVLFTHDADFLDVSFAGADHCGIVYCAKDTRSIGQIIRFLALICDTMEAQEMAGRVEFV